MSIAQEKRAGELRTDFDAVVIGAGFSGLGMLYRLRELGMSARVLEAADDVGGTWYWNRYPGARTDSESHYYCYSFSKELLEEWDWTERYSGQREVLSYLEHVADRFDLRRDIQFDTRVTAASYDDANRVWTLTTEDGETLTARFFISAMGILSAPYVPEFPGLESFEGEWYQTSRWPKEEVDLTGKRVGIIGTGATGIQAIPVISQQAAQLTVFQRTPNYVVEAQNTMLDDKRRQEIRENYDEIWRRARNHPFAMPFESPGLLATQTDAKERERVYEEGWRKGGFKFLFETFDDITVDMVANDTAAEFVRTKIRETVSDPEVAELLSPRDYPLGGKRLPAGHQYFEAYNRENVTLVDVRANPIAEITPTGIRTTGAEYALDIIVFATGFDAFTGSLTRLDIHGRNGILLRDKWESGPITYLGLGSHDFPNMFIIAGPQSPFANLPTCSEKNIDWITAALRHMRDNGYDSIEPTSDAEQGWGEHTREVVEQTVMPYGEKVNTWFMGANIPGKAQVINVYFGGAATYFQKCEEVADDGYRGFELRR